MWRALHVAASRSTVGFAATPARASDATPRAPSSRPAPAARFAATTRCSPARWPARGGNRSCSQGPLAALPDPGGDPRRLAVDARRQGEALGARLLDDALERVCRAAQEVAVPAVVVHAIDDGAVGFYERFGFCGLSTAPRTLMVTLAELRAAGYRS